MCNYLYLFWHFIVSPPPYVSSGTELAAGGFHGDAVGPGRHGSPHPQHNRPHQPPAVPQPLPSTIALSGQTHTHTHTHTQIIYTYFCINNSLQLISI